MQHLNLRSLRSILFFLLAFYQSVLYASDISKINLYEKEAVLISADNSGSFASLADSTPAFFTDATPYIKETGTNFVSMDLAISEPGSVYYIISGSENDTPTAEQVINGLNFDNSPALKQGALELSNAFELVNRRIEGLQDGSTYSIFLVVEDLFGNQSEVFQLFVETQIDYEARVVLEGTLPQNYEEGIPVDANFEIYFSEEVAAGQGNIDLYNSSTQELAFSIPAETTVIEGFSARFSLTENLETLTGYYFLIDSAAFISKFNNGKVFNGISDPFKWSFFTNDGTDTRPPMYVNNTPNFSEVGFNFFSLDVALDEPGDVYYIVDDKYNDQPNLEQMMNGLNSLNEPALASGIVTGNTAFEPLNIFVDNLQEGKDYHVFLLRKDALGNVGFVDHFNVATEVDLGNKVVLYNKNPLPNDTETKVSPLFQMEFSEEVFPGSGSIYLFDQASGTQIFSINILNANVEGNIVNFGLQTPLEPLTTYYVLADSGLVVSAFDDNKVFQGITSPEDWSFTTNDGLDNFPPNYVGGTPTYRNVTTNGFAFDIALDEPGKVFYVVTPPTNDGLSNEQIINGLDFNGNPALASGTLTINTSSTIVSRTINNLQEGKEYNLFLLAEDTLGNMYPNAEQYFINTQIDYTNKVVLEGTNPYHQQTEVFTGTSFELYFSEEVKAGVGDIVISNAATAEPTATIASDALVYDFQSASFTLPNGLEPFTEYFVTIDSGAIVSKFENKAFWGIQDVFAWRFTTNDGSDMQPPSYVDNTPYVKSKGTDFFSMQVALNEPGLVYYIVLSNNADLILPSAEQVINGLDGTGNVAAISGVVEFAQVGDAQLIEVFNLEQFTEYRVFMVAQDFVGNFENYTYETWVTTEADTQTSLVAYNFFPNNGAEGVNVNTAFSIDFSEEIFPVTGNINIYDATTQELVSSIDVQDTSLVQKEHSTLMFKLNNDLMPLSSYFITLDAGIVRDSTGEKFFDGAVEWFFATNDGADSQAPFFVENTPWFNDPQVNTAQVNFALDEPGKVFYLVMDRNHNQEFYPSVEEVVSGVLSTGEAPIAKGAFDISEPNFEYNFEISGLAEFSEYDLFLVTEDTEGNRSNYAQAYGFRTAPDLSNKVVIFDRLPYRQAQGIMPGTSFKMSFSEDVFISGGKFIVRNWLDDAIAMEISLRDSSQVYVNRNEVVIVPTTNALQPDSKYYIQIGAGFITDITGAKSFRGILAKENWWFTTNDGTDVEAPFFVNSTPALINYTGNAVDLELAVNEPALVSYILIEDQDHNTEGSTEYIWPETMHVLEGFDPNTNNTAFKFGSVEMVPNQPVTVPFTGLNPDIRYRAFVVAQDTLDNIQEWPRDAWIEDDGPMGLEVVDALPFPGDSLVPVDTYFNLVFSEPVVTSTGEIKVLSAANDSILYSLSVADTNQVKVDENLLFFKFPGDLLPFSEHYILFDSAAVSNVDGTEVFEGARDKETWFFTTSEGPQPPFFAAETPKIAQVNTTGFTAEVALNASGKVYYVVAKPATDQMFSASNIKNGRDDFGNEPLMHGVVPVDFPFESVPLQIEGLFSNSYYEVFFAAEDLEGRLQPEIYRTGVRTEAKIPNAPVNLAALALSSKRIALSWVDDTNEADFYMIFRKVEGSAEESIIIGEVSKDTRQFVDFDLQPDTRYVYFVVAINVAGESEPSLVAAAKTFTNVLPRPIARKASNVGLNGFTANWDALSGAGGYVLQVASDTSFSAESLVSGYEEVFTETNTYEFKNLSAATTYFYRVYALSEDGTQSSASNLIGVKTLSEAEKCGSVLAVSDSIISPTEVQLMWEPLAGVENYAVRTTIPGTDYERVEFVKTAGIILFDLQPETSYVSEVVAICKVEPLIRGEAFAHSFTTEPLPVCSPVTNLVSSEVSAVSTILSWDELDTAEGYFIAYKESGAAEWISEDVSFENKFAISGLNPETTYEVEVRVICSFENRHASEAVSTTITTTAGDITCTAPTEFDIAVEGKKVSLTWTASVIAEVQVYVNDAWLSLGEFESSFGLFQHPTGEFKARIRTICENGLSSAWTDALPYKVGGIAPIAPTALEANAVGRKAVFLNWEDNADNEKGYKVERKAEGGLFRPIAFVERDQTVFTDVALEESTTYYYRVFALNDVQSPSSNIAEVTTLAAPNPPSTPPFNVSIAGTTQTAVNIAWEDTAKNVLGYRIVAVDEEGIKRAFNTENRGEFMIGQLRPARKFAIKVQSFNEDGVSDFSPEVIATTASEPVPPAKPLFTAQGVDVDKIFLSWEIEAGAGIKIERRKAEEGAMFEEIATVLDETEFVDDAGLTENTLYEYRLRAVTADGNSDFAAATQARTLAALNITAPESPIAFLAKGVSQTQINLKWENAANNARGLLLERKEMGTDFYLVIDTLGPRKQAYQDAGLSANGQYQYRLTAFNKGGSAVSVEAEASTLSEPVPPAAATALLAEWVGAKRAILVWQDNAVNEEGYKLYRNGEELSNSIPADASTYLDEEGLMPNTEYAYVLVAYNVDGEATSDTLRITTRGAVPSPPVNLAASLGDESVAATWEAPEMPNGEVLYTIGGKFFIGGIEVGTYTKDSIDATTFAVNIPAETQQQITDLAAIIPNVRVALSIAVAAQNQFGYSALSEKVVLNFTAAELAAGSGGRVKESAVAAPDRLSGYTISATSTGLAWDDRSQNEDGFIIYRAPADNPFALSEIGTVDADVSEFVDENITEGVAYNYLVVATLGDEKSGNSNILTFNNAGSFRKAESFSGTEVSAALSFTEGDMGYVLTGANAGNISGEVWAYNVLTNSWIEKATFPGAERMYATGFYLNGSYYMGLGSDGTQHRNDLWKYDTATDTWTQLGDFPGGARAGAVSFVLDGTAYLGTGSDGSKHLKDFWKYNASTDTWTQLNNFGGVSRSGAVAFAINSKGYIATGDNGAKLSDVWEYNSATDSWIQKSEFGGSVLAGANAFVLDGKAYISHGDAVESNLKDAGLVAGNEGFLGVSLESVNEESRSEQLWEYDPATDTWSSTFNKFGEGRSAGIGMVINNRAYVGLGVGNDGLNRFDLIEFSPSTMETDKPDSPSSLVAITNTDNNAVDLNWTENATDAIEVRVERASSANGTFTVIDTLPAGTTSYSDTQVGNEDAQYFYRVRSVNHRGFSPYSNVADASITTGLEDALLQQSTQVYPNPSTGLYNLEFALPQQRDLTLRVYNSVGRLISETDLPNERLQFIHQVNLNNEATGVYLLQISSAKGGQHTLRVVKE